MNMKEKNNPEISIILLIWNKAYEMNLILKALSLQDCSAERFEVIVVDDGSSQPLDNLIKRYQAVLNIVYLRGKHTGNRSANREKGVVASSGRKIIFLDGDMIPALNMVSAFDNCVAENQQYVCLGTRTRLFDFDHSLIDEDVIENNCGQLKEIPGLRGTRYETLSYLKERKLTVDWMWHMFYSHSICIWKETYLAARGFDDDFSHNWGAEDIELGFRLHRAGCRILIEPDIHFYHIHHDEDVLDKEKQLAKNYALFYQKHPCWQVELFIKEKELNPQAKIEQIDFINGRQYQIDEVKNAKKILDELPRNTVLYSVSDPVLLASEKILQAFIPQAEGLEILDAKISNIIGMVTSYSDKHFDCAVIPEPLLNLHRGIGHLVLEEATRIAKTIFIINLNGDRVIPNPHYIPCLINPRNFVMFQTSGNYNHLTWYHHFNLALAAAETGLKVGIYSTWYTDKRKKTAFLAFSSPAKQKALCRLRQHQLEIISYKIPNILEWYLSADSYYPEENRIFWESLPYLNQEELLVGSQGPSYSHYLLPASRNRKRMLKDNASANLLKYGVDRYLIEDVLKKTKTGKEKDDFVFLWSDTHVAPLTNLELLLACFTQLFANNNRVRLRLLASNNHLHNHESCFYAPSYQRILNNRVEQRRTSYDHYFGHLREVYKSYSNISFETRTYEEEELFHSLGECDCFVHLNANLEVFPLTMTAIALGKRPITPYTDKYEDYFDEKMCLPVQSILTPLPENTLVQTDKDFLSDASCQYLKVRQPTRESLLDQLTLAYRHPEALRIEPQIANHFMETNSWHQRANELKEILLGKM